jgi:hypothetical protein
MQKQIKILENFISPVHCDYLETLINESNLPLFFNGGTVISHDKDVLVNLTKHEKDSPQFTHTFFINGGASSSFWSRIEPIIFNFVSSTGAVKFENLIKCKLNLNYRDTSYANNEHFPMHIDKEDGVTAIYYINDADGDTLFFDKNKKITQAITPKKGMLVYFNSNILHAGQPPKKALYRSVINFNWR